MRPAVVWQNRISYKGRAQNSYLGGPFCPMLSPKFSSRPSKNSQEPIEISRNPMKFSRFMAIHGFFHGFHWFHPFSMGFLWPPGGSPHLFLQLVHAVLQGLGVRFGTSPRRQALQFCTFSSQKKNEKKTANMGELCGIIVVTIVDLTMKHEEWYVVTCSYYSWFATAKLVHV